MSTQETTALQRQAPVELVRAERLDLQKPLWQEIKRIFCHGASDVEMQILARVVEVTQLDIFSREIFWIPKIGSYISHKGYWALAMRSEFWDGFAEHEFAWIDKDGVINKERRGTLFSVKATGWRKDMRFPIVVECLYSEWAVPSNPNWKNRAEAMLALRAERCVLARAFPISGAVLGKGLDEERLMDTIPANYSTVAMTEGQRMIANEHAIPATATPTVGLEETTILPVAVSAGSVTKTEEAPTHAVNPAPVAEKPALKFTSPERAKAEIFTLVNKIMEGRMPGITANKLIQIAWADSVATSETITKATDIEALNRAYNRLHQQVELLDKEGGTDGKRHK